MNQSWTCSLCSCSSAESFCFCNHAATLLCNSCLPTHFSKSSVRYHQNLPLSAYRHHKSPGYCERLQLRSDAVEKAKDSLNKRLQAIDNCIEEFQGKVNQVYQSIWEYGNKVITEIQSAKAALQEEINKSIEEVEATLYEEQPLLQGTFSARIRNFDEATQFTLFQYSLNVCEDMQSIINFNWISEELSYQYQTTSETAISESKNLIREAEVSVSDQFQHQNTIQVGEAKQMVEDVWACNYCSTLNYASNPICYKCQTPHFSEHISIIPNRSSDKLLLEAFEKYVPSSAVHWTCSQCSMLNPASNSYCRCGFVNSKMVSFTVKENSQNEVISSASYVTMNMCWTCSCGYNQPNSTTCLKCKAQNPGAHVGLLESSAPQLKKLEEVNRAPSAPFHTEVWTCSCGCEYNLKTSEKCAKCSFPNPFLPPKQQSPQKCTLCNTRPVNGSAQLCTFCSTIKPIQRPSNDIYWECIKCDRKFILLGKPCLKCKKTQEEVLSELKNDPAPKLPNGPMWNCNKCNSRNLFSKLNCHKCGYSKLVFRCMKQCGTVVESFSDVCADCLKKKEAPNQTILKERDGGKSQCCPTCGSMNCKEHAAAEVNPSSS